MSEIQQAVREKYGAIAASVTKASGRDVRRRNVFGNVPIGRREVPPVFGNDAFDGARLSELLDLRAAHPGTAQPPRGVPERDLRDPFGTDIRERIDQHAIHDAEHGARGADPERKGDDGGEREAGKDAASTATRKVSGRPTASIATLTPSLLVR